MCLNPHIETSQAGTTAQPLPLNAARARPVDAPTSIVKQQQPLNSSTSATPPPCQQHHHHHQPRHHDGCRSSGRSPCWPRRSGWRTDISSRSRSSCSSTRRSDRWSSSSHVCRALCGVVQRRGLWSAAPPAQGHVCTALKVCACFGFGRRCVLFWFGSAMSREACCSLVLLLLLIQLLWQWW